MRRITSSPPLIGLLAFLGACSALAESAPRRTQPECTFGEDAFIPLQGAGLSVAATLNDQPLFLEISTGLGLSSVRPEVVQRLQLPEDPLASSSYPGPSGSVTRRNVLTRSLRLGGQEWTGRSLAVRPFFGPTGGPPSFDGVIAANLLREAELELDLPRRRVAIHRGRNCRPGNPPWAPAASTAMELRDAGVPVITVRVNGQPVRAVIHSGNNASAMSEELANRLGLNSPTGTRGTSYGSDSAVRRGREYRLDELAVGGEVLRNQAVFVAPNLGGPRDELLGQDWLQQRKVWLSYANRRLFLAAPGS